MHLFQTLNLIPKHSQVITDFNDELLGIGSVDGVYGVYAAEGADAY